MAWFAALGVSGLAASAHAYPQYVAKGATTCGSCHYTPTGGGFPTAYGHGSIEATIYSFEWGESLREHALKNGATGYDEEGNIALQADFGADVRGLLYGRNLAGTPDSLVIPMLTELGVVLAVGPTLFYGGVTLRPPQNPRAIEDYIYSREHWLGARIGDTVLLRVGRLAKPFGLRLADHTQYSRVDLDLDMFSQSYGLEVDWTPDNWTFSLAAMVGELIPSWGELEPGAFLSASYSFTGRASVGASIGAAGTDALDYTQASVHTRVRLWERTYVLAELATRLGWDRDPVRTSIVDYVRLGWFVTEALDVYLETGHRFVVDADSERKQRYTAGVAWHPLPWVELIGAAQIEEQNNAWNGNLQLQLHLIY